MPHRLRRRTAAVALTLVALAGASLALPTSATAATDSAQAAEPALPLPRLLAPYGAAPLYPGEKLEGALPRGGTEYTIQLSFDGGPRIDIPLDNEGYFQLDVSTLSLGAHPYAMRSALDGGKTVSSDVTGTLTIAEKPEVERIGGADRYAVSVGVSQRAFPTGSTAPVVYVATGANYPDALSAGPAAVHEGGPLLLVAPEGIPSSVAAEIQRLKPERIVIAGGPASVSPAIEAALADLVDGVTVERRSGADRYAASGSIIVGAFDEAARAYAATGENFPDALSAGPAAAAVDGPVALVNGTDGSFPQSAVGALSALGTTAVTVVGGPLSINPDVLIYLGTVPATVDRIDGADRFNASLNLNRSAFTSEKTVYLATGYTFPDALTGGVLAGMEGAPLYVVPYGCVPSGTLADFVRLGVEKVVVLGGPSSISEGLSNCGQFP